MIPLTIKDQNMHKNININSVFFALLLLPTSIIAAETIYKSIDESGNISYSTQPPKNGQQTTPVEIAPPPSEDRIKAAQQRQSQNQITADLLDENRKKRDKINAENNRVKREKQILLQQQKQAETNNDNHDYGYPYIPGRYPGQYPNRPIHRPIQLPAR